jgi:hypothetical protein
MMYSCSAMGVRGEIVELGRSLMSTVWHGVSFPNMVPRTGRIRCLPEPHAASRWNPAACRWPNGKVLPRLPCAITPQGTSPPCAPSNHSHNCSDTQNEFLSGCGQLQEHMIVNRTPDRRSWLSQGALRKLGRRLSKSPGALQSALTPARQALVVGLIERPLFDNEKFFALYR